VSQKGKEVQQRAYRQEIMGLDLLLFQADKDGEPELIKQSQKARYKSAEVVDEIQEDYKQWTRGYSLDGVDDSEIQLG
jgi:hypothetical protein